MGEAQCVYFESPNSARFGGTARIIQQDGSESQTTYTVYVTDAQDQVDETP
jgi:hypothetical protein